MSNKHDNDDSIVAIEQAKKQKSDLTEQPQKKPKRHRNRPDLAKFGEEYVEPGDNTRYLRYARVSLSLPPIDISDPKQVEKRINDYFDFCEENDRKPNIKGLGNWLGVSRETVNTWKRGEYRSTTHSDLIKKAVDVLEEMWWDYGNNGKVNPASWIFIGKNAFQAVDQQQIIITPQNTDQDMSAEDIAKRYLEDGKTIPTTFTDGVD